MYMLSSLLSFCQKTDHWLVIPLSSSFNRGRTPSSGSPDKPGTVMDIRLTTVCSHFLQASSYEWEIVLVTATTGCNLDSDLVYTWGDSRYCTYQVQDISFSWVRKELACHDTACWRRWHVVGSLLLGPPSYSQIWSKSKLQVIRQ